MKSVELRPTVQTARMVWLLLMLALPMLASAQQTTLSSSPSDIRRIPQGTMIRLNLPHATRIERLRPGTSLEATLARPLYSDKDVAIAAGTRLTFVVASFEKAKRPRSTKEKLVRGIDRAFNPLDHNEPPEYALEVRDAALMGGLEQTLPMRVSFLRLGRLAQIRSVARGRDQTIPADLMTVPNSKQKKHAVETLLLQLEQDLFVPADFQAAGKKSTPTSPIRKSTRTARAYLLTSMSASKNQEGDLFQARLAEPADVGDFRFSAGSLVEGRVARSTPPRWLSRPGVLVLRVDRIVKEDGEAFDVPGTLEEAEADSSTPFVMDEEGAMHGRKPGVGNALVDIGFGYVLGKFADDLSEAPIRAIGAGMSDASVATAARYVGFGAATIFLLTRHGRDVKLPKYSEIEIEFGRGKQTVAEGASGSPKESSGKRAYRPATLQETSTTPLQ